MPVNEFEKQVQQKLDELQLRPSPTVWTEVEKKIRTEKKRRRVLLFWWLMPVLLISAGIGYKYWRADASTQPVAQEQTGNNEIEGKKTNGESALINEQVPVTNDKVPAGSGNNTATPNTETVLQQQQPGLNEITVTQQSPPTSKKINQPVRSQENFTATTDENSTIAVTQAGKEKIAVPLTTTTTPQAPGAATAIPLIAGKETVKPETKVPASNEVKAPIIPDSSLAVTKQEQATPEAITPVAEKQEPIKVKNTKKWQFGVELRPGVSNTVDGLRVGSSKSMDISSSPNITPGLSSSIVPLAPPVIIGSPQGGFSMGIDLIAKKPVSRRVAIDLTLGYQYLSTYIEVGGRVESTRLLNNNMSGGLVVDNYYNAPNTGNGNSNYTNRYHILNLGGTLAWKIIDRKKFSMSWDNGFSYGRLLGTNALLYDGNARSYYQDFDAFNKSQFTLNTGLAIPVWNNKAFNLILRPFASYTLTPVMEKSNTNYQFTNYGIGLRFMLPQK